MRWQPTMQLRFVERRPTGMERALKILQQKWICCSLELETLGNTKEEWRDVPVEGE